MTTIATNLSEYFKNMKYEDLAPITIENIKALLMDYLSVAIRGSQSESGVIVTNYMTEKGGIGESTLIGNNTKVPAESAAFANAVCSHSLEMDDVDRIALFHFSPPIMSAALAVAESMDASGKDFIVALGAATEMMERLSRALNPSLRNRGFHTTPTCGVFGAAIAAAVLLGSSKDEMISTMGLAGAQVAGLMEMYGESMQKRFNPGPASQNGIMAAKMAKRGFTGASTIFEGIRGVCQAYSDDIHWEHLKDVKKGDYIFEVELKPYACARPIHSSIDASLALRKEILAAGLEITDIERVVVDRHPMWAEYHTNQSPSTYHDAQMSLPYSVALAFVNNGTFFDDYLNSMEMKNPVIFDLCRKVEIVSDSNFPTTVGCRVTAYAKGQQFQFEARYPKGSVENSLTAEDRKVKFTRLVGDKFTQEEVIKLDKLIGSLEKNKIADIFALLKNA